MNKAQETGITIHRADSRGAADFGWLKSRHTFSFANYFNPERVQFGALRVLNDDEVAGGQGFGTHPHRDMEIVSIPLAGGLEHKDSMGTGSVIRHGEVQVMSAGTGVLHSEYNASTTENVNFLQIWILPEKMGIEPRYEQKAFDLAANQDRLVTVVSPEDKAGALWINQQARFSLGQLSAGSTVEYETLREGNGVYAFVIDGSVDLIKGGDVEATLNKRDAAGLQDSGQLKIHAREASQVLLIDVPMR
ncbi:MAG: pirin family protein [bacterium]|nr:pirin family protein [bacterium]